MKNYEAQYINLCKQFIKGFFKEHCIPGGGVYTECFFEAAEKSKLYVKGTYGTPMSEALSELVTVETVSDKNGEFKYNIFKLK